MKSLQDYTKEEVRKFEEMHSFLSQYNKQVQTKQRKPLDKVPYTDHEMMMYSRYRELLIAAQCEEEVE